MAETITITIDKKIYKRLVRLKLDKDLRTFNEVLLHLFEKKKKGDKDAKSVTNNMTENEKLEEDIAKEFSEEKF